MGFLPDLDTSMVEPEPVIRTQSCVLKNGFDTWWPNICMLAGLTSTLIWWRFCVICGHLIAHLCLKCEFDQGVLSFYSRLQSGSCPTQAK